MWEQYKKTFIGTQLVIAIAAWQLYGTLGRRALTTAMFVLMMQVGAAFGAAWAHRLKKNFKRQIG